MGTLAKARLSIRPGGFDDANQGWTGGYATRGSTGAVYLNGEFTVQEGPYARSYVSRCPLRSGLVRPLPIIRTRPEPTSGDDGQAIA